MAEQFNRNNAADQPSENEQITFRKEKLEAMRAEGMDPFAVTTYDVRDCAEDIKKEY